MTETISADEKKRRQYAFWRRRLAGETPAVHDGDAHAGFYRLRGRNGEGDEPIAYWFTADDVLRCSIGHKLVDESIARDRWMWAQKLPISHELYNAVLAGANWPDQHEAVTRANNAPADDSFEGLRDAIEDLAREAAKLIEKGAAKTQDESDRAADLANRLGSLYGKADKAREIEKDPHWEKCKQVDEKWRPLKSTAEIYKKIKIAVITPFLKVQAEAKEKAEREAREAAEASRREAEKAQAEAERVKEEAAARGDTNLADAAEARAARAQALADEAEHNANEIAAAKVTAGTRGRSIGLRTGTKIVITNRAEAYLYFKDRPDFMQAINEVLQRFAEAEVKSGTVPPGVTAEKERTAA